VNSPVVISESAGPASPRPPNDASPPIEGGLVFRLAVADLRHDWILSLCLVLALAAIIAPLLLLFGLKFGTIQTLRSRLIQDPLNREIRPLASVPRIPEWFQALAAQSEVGFVVPTTRQIAASVTLRPVGGAKGAMPVEADLIPTAQGDPLLLENDAPVPGNGQIVLSARTAQALGVQVGDKISASATRSRGADSERANVELSVVGSLPMRATSLNAVYARLDFLEAVEAYKDGLAVPELGWEGTLPIAKPEYDGAIILVPERLPEERKLRLITETGFSVIEEVDPTNLNRLAGWSLGSQQKWIIYHLSSGASTVGQENLSAVRDQLRGQRAEILPWVHSLEVELQSASNPSGEAPSRLRVLGFSIAAEKASALGLSFAPPWGNDSEESTQQILLPEEASGSTRISGRLALTVAGPADQPLTLPVEPVVGFSGQANIALIPAALAGVLRLAQTRPLRYEASRGRVLLERRRYTGFRLYARTIDDVELLRQRLAAEGINVHTEAQRIAEVTELDRHLTRIFWLIGAVGMSGGTAALVASLYASVQRKRRELGILRLVGFSGHRLARFPIYQGLLLVGASYALASALFYGISVTIDELFRIQLRQGESFCYLPVGHQLGALAGALGLAALAASFAAWRVHRVASSAVLRDE
jgi:putative ABC transport system permease protein